MQKRWLFISAGVLAAILAAGFLYMRLRGEDVPAVEVTRQDVVATLTVTGEVESDLVENLSPPVTARIRRVLVDEGDSVLPGQLLVELDEDDVRARLAEAQARAVQAAAQLQELREGTRPEQIQLRTQQVTEAEARIRQIRALLNAALSRHTEAEREARRFASLLQEGFATEQEAEQRQTQLEVAQREVHRLQAELAAAQSQAQQARTQLAEARQGPRQTEIAAAGAARQAAEASAREIAASLTDYRLHSRIAGIVTERLQDPGDLAMPGQTILRVANREQLEIKTDVDENDLAKVRVGRPAVILLDALPAHPLDGRVTEIGSQVNPENGTVDVTVRLLPGAFRKLGPVPLLTGMTADVNIVTARLQNVMVLPATAVRREGSRWIVYRIMDGSIRVQPVRVERLSVENYRVLAGLNEGDRVALVATPKLLEKQRVHAVLTDPDTEVAGPNIPGGLAGPR